MVIALMLIGVTGVGCSHESSEPARLSRRGSSTGQEELLLEEHDALAQDLSELFAAYDAMVDPDASDEQIREAELSFTLQFREFRFGHSREHLDAVRTFLLRQYEAETGRRYKPATHPSTFPADD
jgi:hypothetical protein